MARTIMLIPITPGTLLTAVSIGVLYALQRKGAKAAFFKPITQEKEFAHNDHSTILARNMHNVHTLEPFTISHVSQMVGTHQQEALLEQIVARYRICKTDNTIALIEGFTATNTYPETYTINYAIAQALEAEILLVLTPEEDNHSTIKRRIAVASAQCHGTIKGKIRGVIINDLERRKDPVALIAGPGTSSSTGIYSTTDAQLAQLFSHSTLPLLAYIPDNYDLMGCRASDIAHCLQATIINRGVMQLRRIHSLLFCTQSINCIISCLQPGMLLVAGAHQLDVIMAACLAAIGQVKLSALLLTEGRTFPSSLETLCRPAFATGLPILSTPQSTYKTACDIAQGLLYLPVDDPLRITQLQKHIADQFDTQWLDSLLSHPHKSSLFTPAAFRCQLTEWARQANKRIVLPEGEEPRTLRAAALCAKHQIAHCVLLGKPHTIQKVARMEGITLPDIVQIIDPHLHYEQYIPQLITLRQSKGMDASLARRWLQEPVILATLMVTQQEADGMVSGAVHTTANTIRPALQLIKTAPHCSLVSSVFFMLFPEQVLLYGDCAINPNPTPEQLAEIAIQSAQSAAAFQIEPRVAFISYSTADSGTGCDVDKVHRAVQIAQSKRPDLLLDGPLQYDAASVAEVARTKAPHSPVAGRATVFIFPDLNTGNTTYKAVQRAAQLLCIGPMLQGLRRPVNDLSRGASVDDIVYTIALTAIQAHQTSS